MGNDLSMQLRSTVARTPEDHNHDPRTCRDCSVAYGVVYIGDDEAKGVAEAAARLHFAIATSPDSNVAWWRSPVYRRSIALVKAAIKVAYPELSDLKVGRVIDVWQDCGESIAHCVRYVRENRESRVYTR